MFRLSDNDREIMALLDYLDLFDKKQWKKENTTHFIRISEKNKVILIAGEWLSFVYIRFNDHILTTNKRKVVRKARKLINEIMNQ